MIFAIVDIDAPQGGTVDQDVFFFLQPHKQ